MAREIGTSVLYVFVSIVLASIVGVVLYNVVGVPALEGNQDASFVVCLLFLVTSAALVRVSAGVARGYGLALAESLSASIAKPAVQSLILVILYFSFVGSVSLNLALGTLIVVQVGHLVCVSLYIKSKSTTARSNNASPTPIPTGWVDGKKILDSMQFAFLNTVTAIEKNADVLIVGLFHGPQTVAVYSFCTRIYNISAMSQAALSTLYASKAAQCFGRGDLSELSRRYKNVTIQSGVISLAVLIVFLVFGRMVLEAISPGFGIGYAALILLLVAGFLRAAMGPTNVTANMVGAQGFSIRIVLISLLLGLVIMVVCTKYYGIVGTAVGFCFMVLTRSLGLRYILRKRYGVKITFGR